MTRHLQMLGLERAPFPPTPDAAAWFQTTRLEAELAEAAHCLRTRAGFVLLTGEVGTGKSTFLRRLLLALDGEAVVTSMVFNTFLQGTDLLAAVLRDFGLEAKGNPAADIETLNRFLVQRWRAQVTCVLVIDDAQNLTIESLELLRLLTNLETGQEKLLQIVLAGQPELHHNLEQPRIRQLTSRICKHVRLDALEPGDVGHYVHFRLAAAGNAGITLAADAAQALHRASAGNPRRIHQIMDRCLYGLYGRDAGQRIVDAALVRTAAAEAGVLRLPRRRPRLPLALAASLAGLLAVSALTVLAVRSADSYAGNQPVAVPPLPATTAVDEADTQWNTCLQRLGPQALQVQALSDAVLAQLPTREGLCLRRQGQDWQAGWQAGLRAEDFLDGTGDSQRLQALQALLLDHGLYDGALDGLYGPRMRTAIRQFQQRRGLPANGLPDPTTLLLFDTLLAVPATANRPHLSETQQHGHG
ncbi:MAG: AAA family ATPase [Stenotrophomonas sp.]